MRLIRILIVLSLSIFYLMAQSSSTTGKIRGTVTDAQTGDPLVGANIIIEGTTIGSATNTNGQFVIPNIAAGQHSLVVTYMGYATQNIKNIEVFPGQSVNLNFELSPASLQGETVEVVAEARRLVVEVRQAASEEKISAQQITTMPVSNIQGLLAKTAGVVETKGGRDQGIHMRGGRTGEVAIYVDGVKINDPVDNRASLDIDKYSVQNANIKLSGMEAEYGDAMSGVVDIILREGNTKRTSISYRSEGDGLAGKLDKDLDFGYKKQYFSLNGPVPFTRKTLTYFFSGTLINSDIASPSVVRTDHNNSGRFEGISKFVFRPKNTNLKVELSSDLSRENSEAYNHSISMGNWLKSYYTTEGGHERISTKFSGTINKNTAWSLLLSYYHNYNKFSSGEGEKYNEFTYISTRLDWVRDAVNNGWYDPKTREWTKLIYENGSSAIRDNYLLPDGTKLADADYETQAFYLYNANEGYYTILNGEWHDPEAEMNAMNSRYHNAGFYYIPALLPEYANEYNPNDNHVYYREFNISDYNDYHYMTDADKDANFLLGYQGDLHNGYYWDQDIFNVFTYGPGRPRYHDQQTEVKKAKFHLTSQWNIYNSLNTGFEISTTGMDYTDIQFANQKPYYDSYHVQPVKSAAWIQNKVEYEDLILNFGLRWDYFHSHSNALYDPQNLDCGDDGLIDVDEPGYDIETNPDPSGDNFDPDHNPIGTENDGEVDRKRASAKMQLSPRFGISFAVSDKTSLFANFNHFFQTPQYGEIFQNVMADFSAGYPLVGNPDIKPEETRYYEFGLMHRFSKEVGLKIAAYYKDQSNRLSTRIFNTLYENNYVKVTELQPVDFATIKGMDIKLKLRNYKGWGGEISYEYLDARGSGSSSREFYYTYITREDAPTPAKEYPLEFDITHQFRAQVDYSVQEGIEVLGFKPFKYSYTSIYGLLRTGRPYTPEDSRGNPLEINSKRLPGHFDVNVRWEKYFSIFSLYIDVRNLFNIERVTDVYKYSGKPDDPGQNPKYESSLYRYYVGRENPLTGEIMKTAEEAYDAHMDLRKIYYKNPYNYGSPRTITLGFGFFL
ncbi:MAG: TonB-dependent receptor [Candidatus Marinimicrobia bacterium]|nr:TonB-dependent receptor [Candidatus Neomarinimicrobiota bacterium]